MRARNHAHDELSFCFMNVKCQMTNLLMRCFEPLKQEWRPWLGDGGLHLPSAASVQLMELNVAEQRCNRVSPPPPLQLISSLASQEMISNEISWLVNFCGDISCDPFLRSKPLPCARTSLPTGGRKTESNLSACLVALFLFVLLFSPKV